MFYCRCFSHHFTSAKAFANISLLRSYDRATKKTKTMKKFQIEGTKIAPSKLELKCLLCALSTAFCALLGCYFKVRHSVTVMTKTVFLGGNKKSRGFIPNRRFCHVMSFPSLKVRETSCNLTKKNHLGQTRYLSRFLIFSVQSPMATVWTAFKTAFIKLCRVKII